VARDGSIDWLCLPRFDSPAYFAALLGTPEHGRWQIAPAPNEIRAIRRRYRLVLETEYETDTGVAAVIDCMPVRTDTPTVVPVVEGNRRGRTTRAVHARLVSVLWAGAVGCGAGRLDRDDSAMVAALVRAVRV
jgi:Trehalase-like, N-terminal